MDDYRIFYGGDHFDGTAADLARFNIDLGTRLSRSVQVIAVRSSVAVLGSPMKRTLSGMTVLSRLVALQNFWLNGESGSIVTV